MINFSGCPTTSSTLPVSEASNTTRNISPNRVKVVQTVNNAEKMQPEDIVPIHHHHQQQQGNVNQLKPVKTS